MTHFTLHRIRLIKEQPSLYALVSDNPALGCFVGSADDIQALVLAAKTLTQTSRSLAADDPRLDAWWLSIAEAVTLAAALGRSVEAVTIRVAARLGKIPGAKRDGRDWRFPRAGFVYWLQHGEHRPGRKPKTKFRPRGR